MTVAWILKEKGRNVVSVLPETPVYAVVTLLAHHRIGAAVVADEAHGIHGIVSERDVVRLLADDGPAALNEPVSRHMTAPAMTCTENQSIDWLMNEMTTHRFRHMPVVADGKLAGIVSIGDVVKFKLAMAKAETEQMRQFVSG